MASEHFSTEIYHGLRSELPPANFWRRLVALTIDYGIITAGAYLVFLGLSLVAIFGAVFLARLVAFFEGAETPARLLSVLFFILAILLLLSLNTGYFYYFEYRKGRTPGKKIMGLMVLTIDGSPRTPKKILLREVGRIADMLLIPALLSMTLTSKRQRLGDLLSGCYVGYSKELDERDQFLILQPADYQFLLEVTRPSIDLSQEVRVSFLRLAQDGLLSDHQTMDMTNPKLKELESFARSFFQGDQHLSLDPRTALLFFVEHCYQITNYPANSNLQGQQLQQNEGDHLGNS